jgi:Xaa-Pro aminopeptidase
MADPTVTRLDTTLDDVLALIHDQPLPDLDLGGHDPAYPDFARAEHALRYARLSRLLEAYDLDAVVVTQEENVRYLTGYSSVIWQVGRWHPSVFLATRDPRDAVLVPSGLDIGAVRGSSWVDTVDGHRDPREIPGIVHGHLRRLGLRPDRVGMETGSGAIVMLPWPVAAALVGGLGAPPVDATRLLGGLRMVKSDAELARIRRAVSATTRGYAAALDAAKAGLTEKELVAVATSTMHAEGITAGTRPTFLNCVSGPDRYALVDSPASDRRLAEGDVVFLDGGGGCDGYFSDIIRLIAIGTISPAAERYAELARTALDTMVAAARPGVTAGELHATGRSVYESAGLAEFYGGNAGHGIGTELWERPLVQDHSADPGEDATLRPGMTLCLEPILMPSDSDGTVAGVFVFEHQVHITADGAEVLSGDLETRLRRAPA